MLDRKFIVENADLVIENCQRRGVPEEVAKLLDMESQRRELLQQVQEFNRQANEVSKSIGQAQDEAERDSRKEQGRHLRQEKDRCQEEHDAMET